MTKKDFALIAGVFADVASTYREECGDELDMLTDLLSANAATAVMMAQALKNANPRFDSKKFLVACKLEGK